MQNSLLFPSEGLILRINSLRLLQISSNDFMLGCSVHKILF